MKTLEELREENRKLKAKIQVEKDMDIRERERKRLIKENNELRNPGLTDFKKNVSSGFKFMGSSIKNKISEEVKKSKKKSKLKPKKKPQKKYEFGFDTKPFKPKPFRF